MERLKVFNGKYTVRNRASGEHRTFRVRTQPADASFAPGERIVALLTGSDNENDYTGFGFVNEDGVAVWRSKRAKPGEKRSHFEIFAELLFSLAVDGAFSPYAESYELLMSGTCAVCNRALTEPESITTGIGPVCREKVLV